MADDYPNSRDCEHGRLRRKCETCDDKAEIDSLRLLVRQLALALDAWADAKDDQELRDLLEKARAVAGK